MADAAADNMAGIQAPEHIETGPQRVRVVGNPSISHRTVQQPNDIVTAARC